MAETEATLEDIFKNRLMAVDAAIVRVMKTRKSLKATLLLSEIISQLRFPVSVRPSFPTFLMR